MLVLKISNLQMILLLRCVEIDKSSSQPEYGLQQNINVFSYDCEVGEINTIYIYRLTWNTDIYL